MSGMPDQSIDDSDADLAKDLRAEVRAQILAGADDKTILANLQERYGDYVLLKPPVGLSTTLLWATPILALIIGAGLFCLVAGAKIPLTQPRTGQNAHQIYKRPSQRRKVPRFQPAHLYKHRRDLCCSGGQPVLVCFGQTSIARPALSTRTAEISQTAGTAQKQLQERQEAYETARENSQKQPENIGVWLSLALPLQKWEKPQKSLTPCEQPFASARVISRLNPCWQKHLPGRRMVR